MNQFNAQPGAHTPWLPINQLLAIDERFTMTFNNKKNFLFAPKTIPQLSALVFLMHDQKIPYSQKPHEAKVFLSLQYLNHIQFCDENKIEVETGCELTTLHRTLFEKKYEIPLGIHQKQSIGEAILDGALSNDRILSVDLIKRDGGIIKWRSSIGPALHHLISGMESLPAVLVKAVLKVDPIPPMRIHMSWSFEEKDHLWTYFKDLLYFSSDWEKLDCLIPSGNNEKAFILGQISGQPEEMEAFKLLCPHFIKAKQENKIPAFIDYFKKQNAFFHKTQKMPLHDDYDYFWYNGLNDSGQLIHLHKIPEENNDAPVWKERVWASLVEL